MFIHTLLDYAIQILYNIESKFPARNMPQIHKESTKFNSTRVY